MSPVSLKLWVYILTSKQGKSGPRLYTIAGVGGTRSTILSVKYIEGLKLMLMNLLSICLVWFGSLHPSKHLWSCGDSQFILPHFFPGQA